jgi:hypothetical protein
LARKYGVGGVDTLEQVKSDIGQTVKGINKETLINKNKIIRVPYLVEKPVKIPLSRWQKFFLWSGGISWVVVVALVVYLAKRFLSLRNWLS